MPLFTYTGKNDQGEVVAGQLDAMDEQTARSALKEMNIQVKEMYGSLAQREQSASFTPVDPIQGIHQNWSLDGVARDRTEEVITNAQRERSQNIYVPLIDTLRIYTGWLLALLTFTYAVGSYQSMRSLPVHVPLASDLILSPLLMQVALGTFLFLLLTSIHKLCRGGWFLGVVFFAVGVIAFSLFRINMV